MGRDSMLGLQTLALITTHPLAPDGEISRTSEVRDVVIRDACWLGHGRL